MNYIDDISVLCYYPTHGKQETPVCLSASFLTEQQRPLLPHCATAGTPAPISWRIYIKSATEAVFSVLPPNKHLSKQLMESYKRISYSSGRTDVTHRRSSQIKKKKKERRCNTFFLRSTRQECHKKCLIWRQSNIQYKDTKLYIFIIMC